MVKKTDRNKWLDEVLTDKDLSIEEVIELAKKFPDLADGPTEEQKIKPPKRTAG